MVPSVRALARYIDHALLQPNLTPKEFEHGCDLAMRHEVATVCVKSVDVQWAVRRVQSSRVGVCAVVGFPHANVTTEVMSFEARRALEAGASEIDMVINPSWVQAAEWAALRDQIEAVNATTLRAGGGLKVIFETGLIRDRDTKVRLCVICRELRVAFVKTSTGFAFARNSDGTMAPLGATLEDVSLLVEHAGAVCGVKASGGIRSFGEARSFVEAGATRIGTTSTDAILAEAARVLPSS